MHGPSSSSAFLVAAGLMAWFPAAARGWRAPSYGGLNVVWQDGFTGPGGSSPDGSNWNMVTGNLGVNGELETYSSSTANVQISGGGTVQLVPWRDGSTSGGWTSGRIESTFTFTPGAGRLTVAEAQIRFGDNQPSAKKGLWPAFWLLGDAIRHGTGWPRCGEIDVLETVNGQMTGYGTVHCDSSPGGRCNEPSGLSGSTGFPDQSWHTWRVQWDRTPGDWSAESITFLLDGNQYASVSASRVGDQGVWSTLAHSPLYFIFNVAVGGNWPGNPNGNTQDGYGSMMEVGYVAVYST